MKLVFSVVHHGESGAGIRPYTDEIAVMIASSAPGGEPGEFAEEMRQFLAEWYDGAKVTLEYGKV